MQVAELPPTNGDYTTAPHDVFLRTLAHDLKTPLATLAWHVQMLRTRLREQGNNDRVVLENLGAIEDCLAEAIASMNQLRDLPHAASGEALRLVREPVDLVAFVDDLVNSRRQSGSRPWRFASTTSSAIVRADRVRLRRVFDNLFENAAKYSRPKQPVDVVVARDGRHALVFIQDFGIGIPEVDLPRVFEPYYRARNAAGVPGEGVGLASVRQLIALHGGAVEVHSRQGAGSLFTVRLSLEGAR